MRLVILIQSVLIAIFLFVCIYTILNNTSVFDFVKDLTSKSIEISFKDSEIDFFKVSLLKKYAYFNDLLTKNLEKIALPKYNINHFKTIINLRTDSVPVNKKTFKYSKNIEFINLYKFLTKSSNQTKTKLHNEIKTILKGYGTYENYIKIYESSSYCIKDSDFNFIWISIALQFLI